AIGYGEVGPGTVADHLIKGLDRRPQTLTEEVELSLPETPTAPPADETMLVSVEGIRGLECRLARCCNPLPGDEITGYVTRGSGISVHQRACKNLQYLQEKDPERLVSLEWATSDSDARFRTRLEILASDRVGLLSHITAIVSDCDINIVAAEANAEGRELARLLLTLDISSRRDLDRLMDRLQKLIDVISVRQLPAAEGAPE
ncbi:MAG: bifunctional (p)ppGpp synthetase/guanosine-3',5'-bis(diphosphate) 3'-pyrophosphohydrolase, partial [Armatimonadetes bacterium]|nr:bifunctional (p)ppGpp synthetase/guanosine-3',5'-bis(diphosphate) 3'-pyrophosphohydrolase [Armatimonadota bacterium]